MATDTQGKSPHLGTLAHVVVPVFQHQQASKER
jgi:hypothetical protein